MMHYTRQLSQLRYIPICVSMLNQRSQAWCFYIRRASASHLLVRRYLTSWGREELNLQCLPHRNGFTVRRNTANRCRFPKMRRRLTPYLCMRLRYTYSIRSARHHRNTKNRTWDSPNISRKLYHWAMFRKWQEVDLNHRSQGYGPCEITTSLPCKPPPGVEPETYWLQVSCSANWAMTA